MSLLPIQQTLFQTHSDTEKQQIASHTEKYSNDAEAERPIY